MSRERGDRTALLVFGILTVGVVVVGIGAHHLTTLGLNYDEVIQAEPAQEFLEGEAEPLRLPGMSFTRIFGRPFPVMTQAYMGALKSQLLIPVFALFEPGAATLRMTTLLWALLGVLFAILWVKRLLGLPPALLAGALVALDPSFLFAARHDWGSSALGFLGRTSGLCFITAGWLDGRRWKLALGGLCLGLGTTNKVDFLIFVAAAALAFFLSSPRQTLAALRSRRAFLTAGLIGFLIGAGPMIVQLAEVLTTAQSLFRGEGGAGEPWTDRWLAILTTLDGSNFHRLLLCGGNFRVLFATGGAAASYFPLLAAGSTLALGWQCLRRPRQGQRSRSFILLTMLLTLAFLLATPRATRIHHALNLYPFPHLVVALVAVALFRWHRRRGPCEQRNRDKGLASMCRWSCRLLASALVALVLLGNIHVIARTQATIAETRGKGRWSDALDCLARELASKPDAIVVSLDWGFHLPLLFQTEGIRLHESTWQLAAASSRPGGWSLDASPRHLYLLWKEPYAVFPYGRSFLRAVGRLPPGTAQIREHLDGAGEVAFLSVSLTHPHRLVYTSGVQGGNFQIRIHR
ncbi:MAG: glycosyltransferase family 39 protein [Planctomycetota bacterium]